MKKPKIAPNVLSNQKNYFTSLEKFDLICQEGIKTESENKYRHFDILRHLKPPKGLSLEEWWLGIKMCRLLKKKNISLKDRDLKDEFYYNLPDDILEKLHTIDLMLFSKSNIPSEIIHPASQDQYNIHSLMEEAIFSSQMEGASTTRRVAKEMLRSKRKPKDNSERMIFNNFETMQKLKDWKNKKLTIDLILEIHKEVTKDTLDKEDGVGRLRKSSENVVVEDSISHDVLHEPIEAKHLKKRLQMMCDFANGKTPNHFIHPIIRAIILHFWLSYDHPFVDGNGRVARALFYYLLLKNNYWIFEYISISEIILKAPVKYGMAFLYTETDSNDLTYFIIHQMGVIEKSIKSLFEYVKRKNNEIKKIEDLFQDNDFNQRQEMMLTHAIKNPKTNYTIESHKNSHNVAYDTARCDLMDLKDKGFLQMFKKKKAFVFKAEKKITDIVNSK